MVFRIKNAFVALGIAAASVHAHAQSGDIEWGEGGALWGCKVLLCMANPDGPTAEPRCRSAIRKLWRELAKGHAFPSCDEAEGGGVSVRYTHDPYDMCPAGTTALNEGVSGNGSPMYVLQRAAGQYASASGRFDTGNLYNGSSGTHTIDNLITVTYKPGRMQYYGGESGYDTSPRVCVGNRVDAFTMALGSGRDNTEYVSVGVYDQVIMRPWNADGAVFDIYVNGSQWSRVRMGAGSIND